jgi:hypothetical protein
MTTNQILLLIITQLIIPIFIFIVVIYTLIVGVTLFILELLNKDKGKKLPANETGNRI